ncbi:Pentatricopeptide repeat-containing protein [Sesamum angolense]|uniref:Pentatricopeptide repeat-containing protein n=1 Tax=Sesamum angolense TaxID=2727404 RepID=A0AAE2BH66_9LAMI|nr:Pentatricopeptide repeat-containing protein [Sesamum angolense]
MAINFPAKLQLLGSVHDRELCKPKVPNRKEARKSSAAIAFQSINERTRVVGGKLFEIGANYEYSQKTHVQELVDQLHSCADKGLLTETRVIHGYLLKSDFDDDNLLKLLNHVIYAYFKCSDFESAKLVFDYLPRTNVFSWSVMIAGFNQQASFRHGLNYFCKMTAHGILPDGFTYSAILQSCIGMGSVDLGDVVHGQIIVRGFGSHVVVSTALLNMYAKLGKVEEAYRVFNSMAEINDVSWNAMISGLTANGLHLEAFDHFMQMKEQGFVPNMYTLVSVLKAVGMLGHVDKGKRVHECVSELGMQENILVGTALIDMYSRCGHLLEARSVFDMNFSECGVNGPWNAMITGYTLCNCSRQALELYATMCQKNIKPDLYTYCSVFDAIANLKCLWLVKEVHGRVLKSGPDLMNLNVENAIADAYSKCGCLEEVKKILNRMKCRDIVSWTTLVTCYSQCSRWEDALLVFSQMREEGFTPNNFTLASVLTACANLCYLEYGRQIHGLLFKLGFETVRYIESALIDMYAKGGSIKEAEEVFNRISNPDVVSMTAVLSGHAYHGSVADALWHFKRMEQMHIKPNSVTLLCVLSACSHAGLVKEGLQYFWSMEKSYGLVPEMEHYASVVDLLGRVGRLNEAFEFIMKMPIEPDEMVWQTLLAACRIHGNIEFGEIAAKNILSLCPEYSSTYVLLSNTYMETSSYKDGVDLRKLMKEQGVRKEPGYSWISVKGKVHRFYAGDTDHPQKDAIYAKLEELRRKMKNLGYVPDLKYALQGED